jgi:hypothetical protein
MTMRRRSQVARWFPRGGREETRERRGESSESGRGVARRMGGLRWRWRRAVVGARKLREGSVGFFYTSPPVVGVGLVGLFWKVQDRAEESLSKNFGHVSCARGPAPR